MNESLIPEIHILHYAYIRRMRSWNFSNVQMPYWRFYWNDSPGAVLRTAKKSVALDPKLFVLVPSDTTIFSSNNDAFGQFYIHFTAGMPFDRVKKDLFVFDLDTDRKAKLLGFIKSDRFSNSDLPAHLMLYSLLFEMLSLVDPNSYIDAAPLDSRIQKAVRIMEDTLSSPFSNDDLASRVYMSVSGFIRLFSEQIGLSPQKYYKKKRIDEACLALHFSNKSIENIAREMGFVDRYHFSREFKKTKDLSPAVFRKRYALGI